MHSMAVLCNFQKYVKSVLQSRETTLNENEKKKLHSHFMCICFYRLSPTTLLFDHVIKLCQTYVLKHQIFMNTFQSVYTVFFF
jgi:hypothetical protein